MIGGGLAGGYHKAGKVEQSHKDLVAHNLAAINSKLGAHATSFTVTEAWTQVVAGTNYFFNLKSNDNKEYWVKLYEPLPHTNSPVQVTEGKAGHGSP